VEVGGWLGREGLQRGEEPEVWEPVGEGGKEGALEVVLVLGELAERGVVSGGVVVGLPEGGVVVLCGSHCMSGTH